MNRSYVEEIGLSFYIACSVCYTNVNDSDSNACIVYVCYGIFLFQLGAFRTQDLQRTHVCILVWITPFQFCCQWLYSANIAPADSQFPFSVNILDTISDLLSLTVMLFSEYCHNGSWIGS
jgi:hypothetical protein